VACSYNLILTFSFQRYIKIFSTFYLPWTFRTSLICAKRTLFGTISYYISRKWLTDVQVIGYLARLSKNILGQSTSSLCLVLFPSIPDTPILHPVDPFYTIFRSVKIGRWFRQYDCIVGSFDSPPLLHVVRYSMIVIPLKQSFKVAALSRVVKVGNRSETSSSPIVCHNIDVRMAHQSTKHDSKAVPLMTDVEVVCISRVSEPRTKIMVPPLSDGVSRIVNVI
jgi:hypothetical protein